MLVLPINRRASARAGTPKSDEGGGGEKFYLVDVYRNSCAALLPSGIGIVTRAGIFDSPCYTIRRCVLLLRLDRCVSRIFCGCGFKEELVSWYSS